MYHFEYVSKDEAAPYRETIESIIHDVQNEVRPYFTFQYRFIGSSSRNMITYDPSTNIGFDFDINIYVNDDNEEYRPDELRSILRRALTEVSNRYGLQKCEDSTRVITIKRVDYWNTKIQFSCDFAIVYNSKDGQQYIRYNKNQQSYTWEFQPQPYEDLERKADYLKDKGHWNDVRSLYLSKKNSNTNPSKHSRSLYAETINECYQYYHQ